MDRLVRRMLAGLGLAAVLPMPAAHASSDAAWAAFKATVTQHCTAAARTGFADPIVIVDAHGSASYGIAIVYGRPQTPKGMAQLPGLASVVCIYDKKTARTELSGPIETNFSAH